MSVCHSEAPVTGRRCVWRVQGSSFLPWDALSRHRSYEAYRCQTHGLGLRHCSQAEPLGLGCFQILMSPACVYEVIKWPRCLLKENGTRYQPCMLSLRVKYVKVCLRPDFRKGHWFPEGRLPQQQWKSGLSHPSLGNGAGKGRFRV